MERWGKKRPMMRIDFDAFIKDAAKELRPARSASERQAVATKAAPPPFRPHPRVDLERQSNSWPRRSIFTHQATQQARNRK